MDKIFSVKGMSCKHCAARVTAAIEKIGFDKTSVDLETNTVTVENYTDSDKIKIINTIEDLGFEVEKDS